MSFPYDKSGKWLLDHHGDQLLRLAGITDIVSWKACPSEVVVAGQLPDGLLEVQLARQAQPALFIVELATYPERRATEQLTRDLLLVYAARQVLPEVLVVVLHPKGQLRIEPTSESWSPCRWTQLVMRWRVVELWTLAAEPLLEADDPGLVPWIPLTQFQAPVEQVLRQCRDIIERKAAPNEKESLLALTQILAGVRYNDQQLMNLLGGKNMMIESPVLQRFVAERVAESVAEQRHKDILLLLEDRFGPVPTDIRTRVVAEQDDQALQALLRSAAFSPDLAAFTAQLGAA